MNKKYIIGIVIIIVVLGLILLFASNQNPVERQPLPPSQPVSPNTQSMQQPVAAVEATGNVDDITAAVLSDIASDEAPAMESDPALLGENDAAISGFGQSLDSTTQ
ncbi:MAG: hypothetical protein A3B25_01310 [Candidatus Ryanbacteria bacterium RIFCSPLOWO2_01_FULL_48_26]|uniref:Uncharacterized protein n=1 Tax=Candidatus Ryanbacteria bacterium RIFCSPLOWO2_01_FULL_48_26 TaxID=1802126 RepID=A0A1G2GTX5_9BACT|nr:MAG: hypothetical protein A3B25_01310 [Candidatus Ryanbacteria bacterium RIFCSPLOWO2_01_FULL_48_26]